MYERGSRVETIAAVIYMGNELWCMGCTCLAQDRGRRLGMISYILWICRTSTLTAPWHIRDSAIFRAQGSGLRAQGLVSVER